MKRMFGLLFSGETIFAAFLVGGIFKSLFPSMPVDLSTVFMVVSMFIACKRLFHSPRIEKYSYAPISLFFAIAASILASMLYTPGYTYALDKTIRFVTVTGWSFLGPFILIKDRESLLKFLKGIIVVSLFTSLYILYQYYKLFGLNAVFVRFAGGDSNNSLGLARSTGLAAISLIVLYVYQKTKSSKILLTLISTAILMLAMLFSGSRMPFLALLCSIVVLILFAILAGNIKRIFPLMLVISLLPAMLFPLYSKGTFDTIFLRLTVLFNSDDGGASASERADRYHSALDMWENNPVLGKGIGSFPMQYDELDIKSYPHNIFLELLSEVGMVGCSLFAVLLLLSIVRVMTYLRKNKWKINAPQLTLIITSFFLFLNVNVSGDINDNRLFFTLLALLSTIRVFESISTEVIEVKHKSAPVTRFPKHSWQRQLQ